MYKCPVKGCDHMAAHAILNSHAKTHGFKNTTEMCKKHGPIILAKYDPEKLRQATKQSFQMSEASFNNIEIAMNRLNKKDRGELTSRTY